MCVCMTVVVLVLRVRMGRCRIKIIVDYQLQAAAHDGRGAVEAWGRKFSEIHLPTEIWEGGGVSGLVT